MPGSGVFVVDPSGTAFAKLRKAGLGVPLLRARDGELPPAEARLAVIATTPVPWERVIAMASRLPTLVIASQASEDDAKRAFTSGAIGYIAMAMSLGSFRRAVLAALDGDPVYSRRTLLAQMRARRGLPGPNPWIKLTLRQRQVLALIAQGATDKEIGARLGISAATAQKHAAGLVRRLGVPNRAAAAASAYGTAVPAVLSALLLGS